MYKYQDQIALLNDCDIQCPPSELFPTNMDVYRFYHDSGCNNNSKNHMPVGLINPIRKLDDSKKCDSLAALSCFDSKQQAKDFFESFSKINKRLAMSIGCNLGLFKISETDGLRTESDRYGHFDFFEFAGFDFSSHQVEEYKISQCNQ